MDNDTYLKKLYKAKAFYERSPDGQYDEIAVKGIEQLIRAWEMFQTFHKMKQVVGKLN